MPEAFVFEWLIVNFWKAFWFCAWVLSGMIDLNVTSDQEPPANLKWCISQELVRCVELNHIILCSGTFLVVSPKDNDE